ncbi:hypothetical protein KDC22_16670 [Paenibacillus tritici]|uniref:hypothetical protein n=1 Tax=Paenibacillus tritici TaxID=1873425 RepID=UPI001BA59C6A|nr:hypothetical protein [Paenibacillus tritici]QUL52115.1 hypothetical protein KDC22_16670 [Paenibacillus tritici]
MNRYLKLVHLEVHRFRYALFSLMFLTAAIQITGLVHTTQVRVKGWREAARLGEHSTRNFSFADVIGDLQFLFAIPILISIVVLGLYVFLIWYRDWIGRDKFAYRLFTLPTARRNVYMAKATAIFVFVFAMVSFQLLMLLLERQLFNWMVPSEYRMSSLFAEAVASNLVFVRFLLPLDGIQFVVYYGIGILAVFVLFTAVLLERSYRLPGIVYAILYVAVCGAAIGGAVYLNLYNYFYPREITAIRFCIYLMVMGFTLTLGFRLVSKKITV